MKHAAFLLLSLVLASPLFAEEDISEDGEPVTLPCANGNILFSFVGNYPITPGKWIRLSTNSTYMVVCQIVYEDTSVSPYGPSTPEEIIRVRQVENGLNLALLKFLQKHYGKKADAELVRSYRAGFVGAKVEQDFPDWFLDNVVTALKERHGVTPLDDVSVLRVSMRAVGPFAEALDAP